MLVVGDVSGGVRGSCEGGKALVQVRGGWFRCEGVDSGAVGGGMVGGSDEGLALLWGRVALYVGRRRVGWWFR